MDLPEEGNTSGLLLLEFLKLTLFGLPMWFCPRVTGTVAPTFVANDYFCESGSPVSFAEALHPSDPLWNGQGCGSPPAVS